MNLHSPSNRQLTTWRKLHQKKHRQKSGLFLAEGIRCVEQLLRNQRIEIEALLQAGKPDWKPEEGMNIPLYELRDEDFQSIVDTETPQGVAAICHIPNMPEPEELVNRKGVMVAVDALQDPGNLGTILRTAVWFGAAGLLCGSGTVDPWHPKVVRSTAGATGALPVISGDLNPLLDTFEGEGWNVILLDSGEGSMSLQSLAGEGRSQFGGKTGSQSSEDGGSLVSGKKRLQSGEEQLLAGEEGHSQSAGEGLPDRPLIVIGSEAHGVNPDLFRNERRRIRIEGVQNAVESLNAAVAAGIALYELAR